MILNMNGGGAALNFRIVGGTTAPANPQENTIWVNTANTVTSWALAFDAPSEPKEGMVWVTIGSSGYNTFNALKKNTLAVAPMAAKQYVGGAWVSRDGKICIDQEWKDFVCYLIKNGATLFPLQLIGKGYNAQNHYPWTSSNAVSSDGFITVSAVGGHGIACIENIDLTNFKTLTIEGTFTPYGNACQLVVWDKLGTYVTDNRMRYAELPNGTGTIRLDVSGLTGEYIVGISSAFDSPQKITNFWAE